MIKYGSKIMLVGSLLAAVFILCAPAIAETRLALIITNAKYLAEVGALAKPHKDGELIAGALKEVGFTEKYIGVVRDADQATLRQAEAVGRRSGQPAARPPRPHAQGNGHRGCA